MPPADPELIRLLDAYTLDALEIGAVVGTEGLRRRGDHAVRACKQTASRSALLDYVVANYVRRTASPAVADPAALFFGEAIHPSGTFPERQYRPTAARSPGDGSADAAALEAEGDR